MRIGFRQPVVIYLFKGATEEWYSGMGAKGVGVKVFGKREKRNVSASEFSRVSECVTILRSEFLRYHPVIFGRDNLVKKLWTWKARRSAKLASSPLFVDPDIEILSIPILSEG